MSWLLRRDFDWALFGLALALLLISVAMIYSLTAGRVTGQLAANQALFGAIGLLLAVGVSRFDYRQLRSLSLPLFVGGVVLLVLVLTVGTTVFGATRWIDLAGFQFQPSELVKLLLIVLLAHALADAPSHEPSLLGLVVGLLLAVGVVVRLILAQPDLGTAAVLVVVSLGMGVAAGLPRRYWLGLLAAGALTLPMLVVRLHPYQLARLETFFQPTAEPLGAGYNVIQSIIAVGNGGLFGTGLGEGTQSQLDFLPVVHTDFIFAGIAESVGFVGSLILLTLLGALLLRVVAIARRAPDNFGLLLAFGVVSLWFIQIVVNIGMNLGLAPVTGIPLPFVSYGGTSLIVNMLALGIVGSIASRSSRVSS